MDRDFIAFRLDSILNKQKIIKNIASGKNGQNIQFYAKSQNFQRLCQEKKKYTEILRKDQILRKS
jgi:hypothetical protein